jgi:hypothetical protein
MIGNKPCENMGLSKYLGTNAQIKVTFMEELRSD